MAVTAHVPGATPPTRVVSAIRPLPGSTRGSVRTVSKVSGAPPGSFPEVRRPENLTLTG